MPVSKLICAEDTSLCAESREDAETLIGKHIGRVRLLQFNMKKLKLLKIGKIQSYAGVTVFAMVMDGMTDDIREEAPWTMMFADDIMSCSESKEQVEEKLEIWLYAWERRGMKDNRRKTEYMSMNERQVNGTVKIQGE